MSMYNLLDVQKLCSGFCSELQIMLPRKHFSSLLRVKELSTDFPIHQPRELDIPPKIQETVPEQERGQFQEVFFIPRWLPGLPEEQLVCFLLYCCPCSVILGCFFFTKPWRQNADSQPFLLPYSIFTTLEFVPLEMMREEKLPSRFHSFLYF